MYQNPHSSGYEVQRKTSGYSSNGDLTASATYLINNEGPSYAGMFYQPSEHEVISSIKYKQVEVGYDSNLREFQESLQGKPFEFYIPQSIGAPDGIGKGRTLEVVDKARKGRDLDVVNLFKEVSEKLNKGIINEIQKAQEEVKNKQFILRDVQIEETLILRRRVRKREIILNDKEKHI